MSYDNLVLFQFLLTVAKGLDTPGTLQINNNNKKNYELIICDGMLQYANFWHRYIITLA